MSEEPNQKKPQLPPIKLKATKIFEASVTIPDAEIPPESITALNQSFERLVETVLETGATIIEVSIKAGGVLGGGSTGGFLGSCLVGAAYCGFFPVMSFAVVATVGGAALGSVAGGLTGLKLADLFINQCKKQKK